MTVENPFQQASYLNRPTSLGKVEKTRVAGRFKRSLIRELIRGEPLDHSSERLA